MSKVLWKGVEGEGRKSEGRVMMGRVKIWFLLESGI